MYDLSDVQCTIYFSILLCTMYDLSDVRCTILFFYFLCTMYDLFTIQNSKEGENLLNDRCHVKVFVLTETSAEDDVLLGRC